MGGHGHLEPLVPLARAAAEAGHTVAFGGTPSMAAKVEGSGFTALGPVGPGPARTPVRTPLLPPDPKREERDLRERFVRRAARQRLPLVTGLCHDWRPDVLACDETDFGAALAAESLGLPFATVLVTASGAFVRPDVVGEALDELRAEHGLPPDPGLAAPGRYLVLSPFPECLRDPAHPPPATAHGFRPLSVPPRRDVAEPKSVPTVYFTLGTVFNMESGDLLARVVEGLRELPIELIATVGPDVDPSELGPQPAHVRVERYLPQASVLPRCDLVVSHGGSGSVVGALAHGLPSVLLPIGADQSLNARRCAELGVAEVLDPVSLTPAVVGRAAARVLADPACRQRAERIGDEIAALPEPGRAVELLERLARERRPLSST